MAELYYYTSFKNAHEVRVTFSDVTDKYIKTQCSIHLLVSEQNTVLLTLQIMQRIGSV